MSSTESDNESPSAQLDKASTEKPQGTAEASFATTPSSPPEDVQDKYSKPLPKIIEDWITYDAPITRQIQILKNFPESISTRPPPTEAELMLLPYIPMVMPSAFPPVELAPSNLVDLRTLAYHIGEVMKEKIFLCHTILPAAQRDAIEMVVEDPGGEYAARLQLYNYSESRTTDLNTVIPCGSFLALKNPLLRVFARGELALRCDDPSQVILLSKKKVEKVFPGIKWPNSVRPGVFEQFEICTKKYWNMSNLCQNETETCKALRKVASFAFLQKRFPDAIRWYSMSLDYNNADQNILEDTLADRAAAFLSLRCYIRVIDDTRWVLYMNPSHLKAVYRHAKALILLQKYTEALEFISSKMAISSEVRSSKSIIQLSKTAQAILDQRSKENFDVDMVKLLSVNASVDNLDDIPSYIGPLKLATVEGKGRGVYATQDIRPGQLLISCEAFALTNYPIGGQAGHAPVIEPNIPNLGPSVESLIAQVAYKVYLEPESGAQLYSLHAGDDMENLLFDSPLNIFVDLKRIHRIVNINCFSIRPTNRFRGLYVVPAFINHSCSDSNAMWSEHADFLIVRAIKPIKKGEEIIIPYIKAHVPYVFRKISFISQHFECTCRLCRLDAEDATNGRGKLRLQYVKEINELVDQFETNPSSSSKKALVSIAKLESLRKSSPQLNACMGNEAVAHVIIALAYCRNFQKCIQLLEKVYTVSKEVGNVVGAVVTVTNIIRSNLALRNLSQVRKWVKILKQNLTVAYGSIEPFKVTGNDVISDLHQVGIDFFQQ